MPLFEVSDTGFRPIESTSFASVGIREREDLQRLLRSQNEVIAADLLVVGEEFCGWDDSRCRIDLLALDSDANLVVIELKRTEDGGQMDLQALRYAAMVAPMTFGQVIDVYAAHLGHIGRSDVDARESVLGFLGWEEPDDDRFAQDVRLVLVSAEFSKEITTTVLWLSQRGLDIRCIRVRPYVDNGRVLVDVQQVIPLPEATDIMVRMKEKEARERSARREHSEFGSICGRFWTGLLDKAKDRTKLHSRNTPTTSTYLGSATRNGASFVYAFLRFSRRIELYIYGIKSMDSKTIFDRLLLSKDQIETRFGQALGWERLENKKACRIRYEIESGPVMDEGKWPMLQDKMIDAMLKLEQALRPSLDTLDR